MVKCLPQAVWVILIIDALCVAFWLMNIVSRGYFLQFGLLPGSTNVLPSLLFAPLIHGSWAHLLSNLLPFTLLSWLVLGYGSVRYYGLLTLVWLGGGILVWLFARQAYHIGLSGVVYGLWAYLLVYAWVLRSVKSLLIACAVLLVYGVMFFGLFPVSLRVSFESHLFGAAIGGVYAYLLACYDSHKTTK
ncbi:MAG: rhomboid family intramembrane serine protease [Plesiomonas sp.]|uniref:rhomboid family intramembrane serine protease n=1 Tax=Plesiomonas sp. TaxID=2486279 RepID=UPI003F2FE493